MSSLGNPKDWDLFLYNLSRSRQLFFEGITIAPTHLALEENQLSEGSHSQVFAGRRTILLLLDLLLGVLVLPSFPNCKIGILPLQSCGMDEEAAQWVPPSWPSVNMNDEVT